MKTLEDFEVFDVLNRLENSFLHWQQEDAASGNIEGAIINGERHYGAHQATIQMMRMISEKHKQGGSECGSSIAAQSSKSNKPEFTRIEQLV